ncbi:hypothetical protein NT01EI_2210 [Edwardsiella ictaluri 93-146]|uniref:Uncharacterized protein n=1 Tax=Edwardsiella ictaluri (strain 93-146) TaxID=634503 RepID=C5BFV8_EDWI9|nr:hypothetical protein NT01EI_2210 [Edwardsiella ictaluri 93-146]
MSGRSRRSNRLNIPFKLLTKTALRDKVQRKAGKPGQWYRQMGSA